MSVVKTVKDRQRGRALLDALNQEPKKRSAWWEQKERILQDWIINSGSDLTVEGALDLVKSQLNRGNEHASLRFKCWRHIIIELAALMDDEDGTTGVTATRVGAGRRGSTNQQSKETEEAGAADPAEMSDTDLDADLTSLSFLRRQEVWLKRRQLSITQKALEGAVETQHSFSPNVQQSQGSMKNSQMSAMEKKMEMIAAETERSQRRKSIDQERKKERDSLSPRSQAVPPTQASAVGGQPARRGSVKRPTKGRRRGTALGLMPDQHTHMAGGRSSAESDGEDSQVEGDPPADETAPEMEASDSEAPAVELPPVDEDARFVPGSFFTKIDDTGKGHYRVRDPGAFLLTSMYKRKDRVTRTPGLSLLVGRLEKPPHEEQVVSAIFDADRFTEAKAAKWWELNVHRFEDNNSIAQKEEMERRAEEHYRTLQVIASRRYSAPVQGAHAAQAAGVGSPQNSPNMKSPAANSPGAKSPPGGTQRGSASHETLPANGSHLSHTGGSGASPPRKASISNEVSSAMSTAMPVPMSVSVEG